MRKVHVVSTVNLLHGDIRRSMLLFAVPVFISMLCQQLYNTVDIMIVGNILGETSLAAIGASYPVYDLLVGFAVGIGSGLSLVTGRSYGSGDRDLLKRSVSCAFAIAALVSVMITLAAQFGSPALLCLLGTPGEILEEANSYISVITRFTAVTVAYNLLSRLLNAVGNSLMPLVALIISSGMNIVLDYFFIAKLGMGVRGAAVATVVAQGFSVLVCLVYIFRRYRILIPERCHFHFHSGLVLEMLEQGISMGLMHSIVSLGSVILQYGINSMGYLTIAAHITARKLFSIGAMACASMATTMSSFVSQNRGAERGDRIRAGMRFAFRFSAAAAVVITVFFWLCAPVLTAWISGSRETEVIRTASMYLRFVAPFYAVLGALNCLRNALQGIGKKLIPLISSVIELIGKTMFVIALIPSFGYYAVIVCEPAIWLLMTAQLFYSFYSDPFIRKAGKHGTIPTPDSVT